MLSYMVLLEYFDKELLLITTQKSPCTSKVIGTIGLGELSYYVIFSIMIHFNYKVNKMRVVSTL